MRSLTLRSLSFALVLGVAATACGTKTTKPPANPEPAAPPAEPPPPAERAPAIQPRPTPAPAPNYKPGDPDSGGEKR